MFLINTGHDTGARRGLRHGGRTRELRAPVAALTWMGGILGEIGYECSEVRSVPNRHQFRVLTAFSSVDDGCGEPLLPSTMQ